MSSSYLETGRVKLTPEKAQETEKRHRLLWKPLGSSTIITGHTASLGYLTPAEFARRYYERHKEEQAMQPWEKAGSLSL